MAALPIPAAEPASAASAPPWSVARRLAFRFAFVYLFFWVMPWPIAAAMDYDGFQDRLVLWVGKHVLRLPVEITALPNGSGDTTYNYVLTLSLLVLAIAASLAWTVFEGSRRRHPVLGEVLFVYARYTLAAVMLGYGFSKVFKLQFPFPSAYRLLERYGDSSPMALLWTFMGYSRPYTVFAGAMEVLGGMLLFFRRTTTLGALVVAGVMTNVVVMNFCYDVPVKVYSSHLLMLAIVLATPDLGRLADLLVFHRPTQPRPLQVPFATGRMRWVRLGLKTAFVGFVLFTNIRSGVENSRTWGDDAPQIALAGAWNVEEMTRAGRPVEPGASHWRQVAISNMGLFLTPDEGVPLRFGLTADDARKELAIHPRPGEGGRETRLSWRSVDVNTVDLDGAWEEKPLHLRLVRIDTSRMLLVTRGFHWVNEYPFNR